VRTHANRLQTEAMEVVKSRASLSASSTVSLESMQVQITNMLNSSDTRAVCKVRGLAAVRRCYAKEAVTVTPSCSGGGNVVVALSSSLHPSLEFELRSF
jgi:hypothetical protein